MAAKESKKRKRDSPQSSSGAPEPAAIDSAVQFDNDDDNEHRGLGGAPEPAAPAAASSLRASVVARVFKTM